MMLRNLRYPPRSGIAMALALGVLAVMIVLIAAIIGIGRQARQGGKTDERRLQTEWLLRAGVERAAMRLKLDPSYTGETWALPAGGLPSVREPAEVRIAVTADPARPGLRLAHIDARLASDSRDLARLSHTYTLNIAGTPARPQGDSDE